MSREPPRLASTTSLCPRCLEPVPGHYEARGGDVYLARTCPDHGGSSRQVWGSIDHWEWVREFGPTVEGDPDTGAPDCCGTGGDCGTRDDTAPDPDTGDLTVDNDHACLAVVEVTEDCNLSCSYCFASSGPGGRERPFEEVVDLFDTVRRGGGPRPLQLSGGEPTVRDDLPALIERAREMGFEHVQVNTNGLRLAGEDGYAERLADAGLTAIYLQFDGLSPETYEAIREVDIADEKRSAVAACRRADLPVVLVPTVVPGVNDNEMGDVVRFALDNRDVVASVNFQPVAHFGRYESHDGRFSLDQAASRLAEQMDAVDARDLLPIPCCSSYCQLATALLPDGDDGAVPLTGFLGPDALDSLSGMVDEADWLELMAGTPVGGATACSAAGCCGLDAAVPGDADDLLDAVLPVSITGFMDADAADADRLENCCISVPTPDGDLVPFCAYNMTTEDGRYALRERYGWGGRSSVEADTPPSGADGESGDGDETAPGHGAASARLDAAGGEGAE
ncbi:MAG: radical SAM protein [Haloferacaceae archaeon]